MRNLKRKRFISFLLSILMILASFNGVFVNLAKADDNPPLEEIVENHEDGTENEINKANDEINVDVEETDKEEIKDSFEEIKLVEEEIALDEEMETFYNLDNLPGPMEIEAPEIRYDIFPETAYRTKRSLDSDLELGQVRMTKDAKPVEGKVNMWDITLRIEGRDDETSSDIVLVIDRSGSMGYEASGGGTRMDAAKTAAIAFADTLLSDENVKTRIAIVSFSSSVTVDQALTDDREAIVNAIKGLEAQGGTLTQAGIRQASVLLENSDADMQNMVLLSDGEPTYSYNFKHKNKYWIPYGEHFESSTEIPESEFVYNESRGNGDDIRFLFDTTDDGTKYYINNGNSTIAEAGFAKNKSNMIYTIALSMSAEGTEVLKGVANSGKDYTAEPEDLEEIFQVIGGDILSAAKSCQVTDPMGTGFVVYGDVSSIIASDGTVDYKAETKTIKWDIGTLKKPIKEGSDIKYAELKYTIEIDDDILNATSEDGTNYATNGETVLDYVDNKGQQQKIVVEVPKVDPILLVIEKKLINSLGFEVPSEGFEVDGREFTMPVDNDKGDYKQEYTVKAGGKKVMTNLRIEDTYTVAAEKFSGPIAHEATDYGTSYNIYGEDTNTFKIKQGDEDTPIIVTNKEKPLGELTITKKFNPVASTKSAKSGKFEFEITGPTKADGSNALEGIKELTPTLEKDKFTFKLGVNESLILSNLPYGEYQVTETDSKGFIPSYSIADGKVDLAINNKKQELVVTNTPKAGDDKVDIRAKKVWVGGLLDEHKKVDLVLYRNDKATDINPTSITPQEDGQSEYIYIWKDLQKFDENGLEYQYSVREKSTPKYYKSTVTGDMDKGFTVTNEYTAEADGKLKVRKIIDIGGEDTRSGKNPEFKFEVIGPTKTDGTSALVGVKGLTEENGRYFFTIKGPECTVLQDLMYGTYEVIEVEHEGFEPSYNPENRKVEVVNDEEPVEIVVTNKLIGDNKIDFVAKKIWTDGLLKDYKPINLVLLRDGEELKDVKYDVIPKEDGKKEYTYTWKDLPERAEDGHLYEYKVKEVEVPKYYTSSIDETGKIITNKYTAKQDGQLTIKKEFDNGIKLKSEIKPAPTFEFEITGPIKENGESALANIEGLTEVPQVNDVSRFFFKLKAGESKTLEGLYYGDYKVEEIDTQGFVASYNPGQEVTLSDEVKAAIVTVTNSPKTGDETVDITAKKIWRDGLIEDYKAVDLVLLRDGKETDIKPTSITPDKPGQKEYTYTWGKLTKYGKDGHEYTYEVKEATVPKYYESNVDGLEVYNDYVAEKDGKLTIKKAFDDGIKTRSAIKPSPTFKFKVTGPESEAGKFEEIFELKAGESKTLEGLYYGDYKVEEIDTQGFIASYNPGQEVTLSDEAKAAIVTVTNSPKTGDETVDITAKKIWRDGLIKDYKAVDLVLLRDGKETDIKPTSITPDKPGQKEYTYTWKNLTKYGKDGHEYTYEVKEATVPKYYESNVDGLEVYNDYVAEKDGKLTIKKAFDDGIKTRSAIKPSPTFKFKVTGPESEAGKFEEIFELKAGESKTLEGLYYGDYKVEEIDTQGFIASYNPGQEVTLSDEAKAAIVTVTNSPKTGDETVDITAKKIWRDGLIKDYKAVDLVLLRDGKETDIKPTSITPDKPGQKEYTYTWKNLTKYGKDGHEYTYEVKEATVPKYYESNVDGLEVYNDYVAEKDGKLTIKKAFDDGIKTRSAIKPSPTFKFKVTGPESEAGKFEEIFELKAGESKTLEGLYYGDYKVEEIDTQGFIASYNPGQEVTLSDEAKAAIVTVTNSPKTGDETVDITAKKIWRDGLIKDYKAVDLVLLRDGKETDIKPTSITPDKPGQKEYTYTWKNLTKYGKDGHEYTYEVKEATVPKYYESNVDGLEVYNDYVAEKDGKLTIKKEFDDGIKTRSAIKPSPTFKFKVTGPESEAGKFEEIFELKAGESKTLEGLYYGDYKVEEIDTQGFVASYNPGQEVTLSDEAKAAIVTVTNSPKTGDETVDITAKKIWRDGLIKDYKAVDLVLLRDGKETDIKPTSITPDKPGQKEYTYTWKNLTKYGKDGHEYTYEVKEATVPKYYESNVDGLEVYNDYVAEKDGKLTIKKAFDDGIKTRSAIKPSPTFKFKVTGPESEAGKFEEIFELKAGESKTLEGLYYGDYKVEEIDTQGFVASYNPGQEVTLSDEAKAAIVTVTNSPKTGDETVDITAKKIWDGGLLKEHVKVDLILLRDGKETDIKPTKVTPEDGNHNEFIYTWENLQKYDSEDAHQYKYTVKEKEKIEDYKTIYSEDGLIVTNKYDAKINGKLTIKKEFDKKTPNTNKNKNLEFKFTIKGPLKGNGESVLEGIEGLTKEGNTYTFKLKAGQSLTLKNLYYADYIVEEIETHGFKPTYSPKDGKVNISGENIEGKITVINNYKKPIDPTPPIKPTIKEITLVGGPKTLTKNVENQLMDFVQYRLWGKDRYGTSADVAKEYNKSNIVLLASGEKYTDELTATVLANKLDAPIMLTRKNAIPAEVKAEINRLGATKVILIGGRDSISEKVEKALSGYTIERIGGPDRYDTAILVGNRVRGLTGSKTEAILVDGTNFPDAIAMTSMGVEGNMPILLTKPRELPASTVKTIKDWNLSKVTIGGGVNSVSGAVANEVKKFATVDRIAGADRYETSVLVAEQVYVKPKHVVIASGEVFPDAIVGAPYATKNGYPIVLSRGNYVPEVVMDYILSNR
ncbi:Cna B-type domain-containing protein [Miniphocaeibacter halophilus]|uniref:Cna B-type domain-containing protein n=1 Tax=Miniphocaeibacter halophilus TaxID=2931922 RepID=A0AC61MU94_9FIRM|nr:Cna B-type domain-containing protein [Miniphocaeibacter halophilus]QQK08205.1 Cna B-type domain-containing protein [Miniphocaeibacter halophilus]